MGGYCRRSGSQIIVAAILFLGCLSAISIAKEEASEWGIGIGLDLGTNDNGQFSQEEIERMFQEAEKLAEEEKKFKERIDGRNSLETYTYNMKNQINDKDKIEADEKEKIESAVKEALEWLDDNQSAEKEDYDEKLKEVEAVCNPIISRQYTKDLKVQQTQKMMTMMSYR